MQFVTTLVLLLAGLAAGYFFARIKLNGASGLNIPGKSPIKEHLRKSQLPDSQATVDKLKVIINRGLDAPRLEGEIEKLERDLEKARSASVLQPPPVAPAPIMPTSDAEEEVRKLDFVRDDARSLVDTFEGDILTNTPEIEQLFEITGFLDAKEEEEHFRLVSDPEEVRRMVIGDWFNCMHRVEALLHTYFREDAGFYLAGLSNLNAALRQAAAHHDLIVAPVRLLTPGEASMENNEDGFAELASIPTIRRKLEALAAATRSDPELGLVIDAVRCRVTDRGPGGELLSPITTWFDPDDWRKSI